MIPSGLDIAFAPMLPWWGIAALGVASLLIVGLALWRRARGAWWRFAALGILLLALANPSVIAEQREAQKDIALLVVDRSPSQRIGERMGETDAALVEIRNRLARMQNLEVREVETGSTGGGLSSDREGTQLMTAAEQALANIPRRRLAGVIALTDGQVHDTQDAGELPGAPVHTLLTGQRGEADRRLVIHQSPTFGMVGKEVAIRLSVEDESVAQGTPVTLTLRRNGEAAQTAEVPANEEVEVAVMLDRGGQSIVEIDAEQGPRELTLINNRAVLSINGVRDRLRVLLVSGEPHAGERTWRNLLKADPSVDLVHFTILRPPEKQDGTPIRELSLISFPIRELFEVKIDEFDLIIFDRYKRRGVLPRLYLGNIAEYVRQGGALLIAAGPDFASPISLFQTPIGDVLPAEPTGQTTEEGFRPIISELGRRHPVTAELSGAGRPGEQPGWGRWFRVIDTAPRSGTVVMEGGGRPLVVLDRVGEGRVAQINSDHMWLWARGFEGGGPQAELLRRIAHWLMKEPELEENDLRAHVQGDQLMIERRSLEPAAETVSVTLPSGETVEVALTEGGQGRATGSLTVEEAGLYRLTDGERTRLVTVGAVNPLEYADVRTTATRMGPIAEATGGGLAWIAEDGMPDIRRVAPDRRTSGQDWIALRENGDYVVTGVLNLPLLPALLTLLLALGALLAGWLRESR
ncbi:hypothetical protein [Oceanibaculum pacificum]|uniref:Glutamine amidotransferase domain-containing protein n=1 Tax=Oceanibaculum pacificum TaxID=580166 RepID=A0A154VAH2_9PROT|nr:hypothetical protein [Oceanibaculum pacificum]KZC98307.1 hypothetical protein AUP43_03760 [Oceanibaculum pacificum]